MRFLLKIILHIIANALAILLASRLISGFKFHGGWESLLLAGAILGIVNSFLRPLLKLLTFPVILLTLGIFSIIINILMLFLVSYIVPNLQIIGLWAGFWGVIIISLVNHFILSLTRQPE
jgi:putative membrane protein